MELDESDTSSLATSAGSGAASGAAVGGPWGAIVGGLIGAGQSAYGIYQKHKADQLAATNIRPTYKIPQGIQDNLTQAQQMALEGLPEEQKTQYLNNLQRAQSFGLNSISERRGGLAGLSGIVQQGNDASMNLLSADSAARRSNQSTLFNARTQLANFGDKAFQFNQADNYYENAAAARGLAGAGLQNVWGGLGTINQSVGRYEGKQ